MPTKAQSAKRIQPTQRVSDKQAEPFFLPDLCRVQAVLFLVITTELFTLLITLARSEGRLIDWGFWGLLSLLGQWIVLSCAAILCGLRNYLSRHSLLFASLFSYGIILFISLTYSVLADRFFHLSLDSEDTQLFLVRNMLMSFIIGGVTLRYFYLQHQWRMQRQAEIGAKLEALQARIRPHFLFNSMNTIASLIAVDPDAAEEAVLDLSELFRATLNNTRNLIPLSEELALCRRYLYIEGLRMGSRMQVKWHMDEADERVLIPPLCLQPLVENAIYHGIQPLQQGGAIHIESYIKNDLVYVLVSNPIPPDRGLGQNQNDHKGNHIALSNIRSRFDTLFKKQAVLKTSVHQDLFTVVLRFPVIYTTPTKAALE
jgi:two-component system sensor histidine kinase AlgZ